MVDINDYCRQIDLVETDEEFKATSCIHKISSSGGTKEEAINNLETAVDAHLKETENSVYNE